MVIYLSTNAYDVMAWTYALVGHPIQEVVSISSVSYMLRCERCNTPRVLSSKDVLKSAYFFCFICYEVNVITKESVARVLQDNQGTKEKLPDTT